MVDAFVDGARALGREPEVLTPGYVQGIDALNLTVAAFRNAAEVRRARSTWVVAAAAPYGSAAVRARRRYQCWIATSLEDEWRSRVPQLPAVRRLAHRVNAPLLLELERRVLGRADRIFAISPASREQLKAVVDRDDIDVLPIPVDVRRFAPAEDADWEAGLERPTVAFVGRGDDPRKNVALLLEAWPSVRARVPEARLVLIGRRPSGTVPDGAVALGEVTDVSELLPRASLFALPSKQEAFGIVAAEALACGIPVVSTPCGGPEDLLARSRGGRLVRDFAAPSFADAIVDLLADGAAMRTMRTSGRAYVEAEHSPQRFRELLEPHLE